MIDNVEYVTYTGILETLKEIYKRTPQTPTHERELDHLLIAIKHIGSLRNDLPKPEFPTDAERELK